MPKLLLDKKYTIDCHFHGLEVAKSQEAKLGEDVLHIFNIDDGVSIILCLDSDGKLLFGLNVNGKIRYVAFNEMDNRGLSSIVEYAENDNSIKLYTEEQTSGTKHILESSSQSNHKKVVNYKVSEKDMSDLQVAIFNHPRIKEFIEYIIERLRKIDPNIIDFLLLDKRFLKMLKLSKEQSKTVSEAVIEYYFIESAILEDGIDIPESKVNY